jgi:hypothetical protein
MKSVRRSVVLLLRMWRSPLAKRDQVVGELAQNQSVMWVNFAQYPALRSTLLTHLEHLEYQLVLRRIEPCISFAAPLPWR